MANVYARIAADPKYANVPPGMLILHRFGGWLPRDHRVLQRWVAKRVAKVDERMQKGVKVEFDPCIQAFQDTIESSSPIYMGFHEMFNQVPDKPPYDKDPTGKPQVWSFVLCITGCAERRPEGS